MENNISHLTPNRLWNYFSEICQIPRPSKKEEKIIGYLLDFGKKHNLETERDQIGNVLIRKPATPGMENRPAVILQSHVDMVCEKNSDVPHDFMNDPILPRIENEWVKATGTTLGADDGIGVAASLAILESTDIPHGPLECLFTIDEETGLTGAFGLKKDLLKGRILLNLDSEDEGQLFIGCAGGKDLVATFALETQTVPDRTTAYKVSITGLKGGHSGDDIHKGLGNAVKLLNRFLWNATERYYLSVSTMQAGNLRNAIAREGFATVVVPIEEQEKFENYAKEYAAEIGEEYKSTEPELSFKVEADDMPEYILEPELEFMLLNSLYACPHGVIQYSREIPGFVQTSTNLASVKFEDRHIIVTTSQRSSVDSEKEDIGSMVKSVFRIAGADIEQSTGYPGWKPDPKSKIADLTVSVYRRLFSQEPEVLAIHAGLECGLIGALYPGMDMISFGPTIKGAHSPDERLHIPSTVKFWELLTEVLKEIR